MLGTWGEEHTRVGPTKSFFGAGRLCMCKAVRLHGGKKWLLLQCVFLQPPGQNFSKGSPGGQGKAPTQLLLMGAAQSCQVSSTSAQSPLFDPAIFS